MVAEVVAALRPRPGGHYADGTVGGGGHAAAILETSAPTGWLSGCDRDGAAVEAARRRLAPFEGRFEIRRGNFTELDEWVQPGSCDGVVLDLGVSSPQLDEGERGFSFIQNGPLDMRMDDRQTLRAAALVNSADESELSRIFREYGEEPRARRLARAVVEERERAPIETTGRLAALIERVSPRHGRRIHPATRVFQALRMAVNNEIAELQAGLAVIFQLLKPEGRLAVITFHSLEVRVVKAFGQEQTRDYTVAGPVDLPDFRQPRRPLMKWIAKKAIVPSTEEVSANPRARSAQLRVLEKI